MNDFKKIKPGIYEISSPHADIAIGIAARSANSIDYSKELPDVRAREKMLLKSTTGINEDSIIFLNQVHGDNILTIEKPAIADSLYAGDADGMITGKPGICLVLRTADCVPVFIYDSKQGLLGAAHSGWRGTELRISARLVQKMKGMGSEQNSLHAVILPSIGPNSYTVNMDVGGQFPGYIKKKNDQIYLNLWQSIEDSLKEEGIPGENIFNSQICCLENSDEFFSHRQGDLGRNLNYGYIRG